LYAGDRAGIQHVIEAHSWRHHECTPAKSNRRHRGAAAFIAKIQRISEYVARLRQVEKANDDMFANIACFEEDEFLRLLGSTNRGASSAEGRPTDYR
jgi:hypothetical protein